MNTGRSYHWQDTAPARINTLPSILHQLPARGAHRGCGGCGACRRSRHFGPCTAMGRTYLDPDRYCELEGRLAKLHRTAPTRFLQGTG